MTVQINGKTYEGNSVVMRNGEVWVDGEKVDAEEGSQTTKIVVEGDVGELKTDGPVEVNGNVRGNVDAGGSVQCSAVGNDVDAGGSVQCGAVGNDVDAGGSVTCGRVEGDVDAGGSVQ